MSLSYADAVHWYFSFARFDPAPRASDRLKLARMNEILSFLDNPHEKFPSILIAGTKGKGSTAALLESVLRAAGYRTGLYTSPHLHSFRERVRVADTLIPRERVVEITSLLQEIQTHFPNSTFFEWVTALAFTCFARENIDVGVIEVGLGGRLDCTNVLTPRVSVITPISFDHMEILGNTLQKIAFEKAGIIKPKIPVVVAPQELSALGEIQRRANKLESRIVNVEKLWRWQLMEATPQGQTVNVRHVKSARWLTLQLPLLGPHQRVNLATALATLDVLRGRNWSISEQSVAEGVATVRWNARFEILPTNGPGAKLVVDGAHNGASAHELVRTLGEVFADKRIHFVFGVSADKDVAGMLEELAPRAASFIFTQAHHARAMPPDALAHLAAFYGGETRTASNVAEALELATRVAGDEGVICITGSLFIAAEARALVLNIPKDGG